MASIHKRTNSPYWVAWYRDPDGKQVCKTTKSKDRKIAQKIADTYEAAYRTGNAAQFFRENVISILKEVDPSSVNVATVKEYFDQWLSAHSGELAETTVWSYRKRLEYFVEFVGEKKLIDSVKKTDALGFRAKIAKDTSNATANNTMKILSSVFGSAMNEGVVVGNPFAKMKALSSDSVTKKHFTLSQVKRLLSVADAEWKSMITFGLYTAQRLGDLCTLTWGQIDFERKEILFTTEKTDRNMAIPAHDALWRHIMTLQKGLQESPIHPRAYAMRKDIGIGKVSREFRRVMVKAGLATSYEKKRTRTEEGDRSKELGELSFHSIRHAAATWLRDVGVSESIAMEIVGHDSRSVDRAYVHSDPDRMRSEINKLPAIS
jgi:integrase